MICTPPSQAKEAPAPSLQSGTDWGSDRIDDVSELLVRDRCRVGGGKSHTSTTFERSRAQEESVHITKAMRVWE